VADVEVDVLVIGAGVVGLACAERFARGGMRTLVLERHAVFGRETSSRSSEVIHAGMYYTPGSRKARLCVRGNVSVYAWCEAHRVPFARVGKYIVATSAEEEPVLDTILERGRANGVELERVTAARIVADEPQVTAIGGLSSPRTGIVDSHALMASLLAGARDRGADVAFRHAILAVEPCAGGYSVAVLDANGERATVAARAVVNAAGLASDDVAALAGIDVDAAGYRLTYVKGSYFRVIGPPLVRRLVYPIPPPGLAGLGVHVTVDLAGGARLGPDVEILSTRTQDYRVDEARAPAFFAAASRYLPGLRLASLAPDQAGIRPKLLAPHGQASDFVIAEESARGLPGWVNLIGIDSPGLTCCLEIAEEVSALVS
jgi:L-2-hydroxyglutarate oxidase LhgO